MTKHQEIGVGFIHIPYNWTYANAAARAADTSVVTADIGKFARQLDDNSMWMLTATTPTWVAVGGGGGGSGTAIVVTLTNKSGGSVALGDVVMISNANAAAFTTDNNAYRTGRFIGVVTSASIANNATGSVCIGGYVAQINLSASASLGNRIALSSVSKQGVPHAFSASVSDDISDGDFGIVLGTGTTPAAVIWNPTAQASERRLISQQCDMNTATANYLYEVPTGRSVIVTKVILRAATASLTTVSFSIGWNSAAYNDVIANSTHPEITGSTLFTVIPAKNGAKIGASGDTLKLLDNTLQGGVALATIDVWGFIL